MGAIQLFQPTEFEYSDDIRLPLLTMVRRFLHWTDLLVILRTKRCRYHCSFCTLPSRSLPNSPSHEILWEQWSSSLKACQDWLPQIDSISLGNEGSVLDRATLDSEIFKKIIESLKDSCRNAKRIALETRPEFVSIDECKFVSQTCQGLNVDLTIGLETIDDHIREKILGKSMTRKSFEEAFSLAGQFDFSSTIYVVVKSNPFHDNNEAFEEAIATVEWVKALANFYKVKLILRLNPLYIPRDSKLAVKLGTAMYKPPSLLLVIDVLEKVYDPTVKWFVGLSTEGLADRELTYKGAYPYSPDAVRALAQFSISQDLSWVTKARNILESVPAREVSSVKSACNGYQEQQ